MNKIRKKKLALEPIDFSSIKERALAFAEHLTTHFEEIADVLLEYESFEVVEDEFARTIDLFRSLEENKEYFVRSVNSVTSFLPRNQPLYAFSCFVVVPSLLADTVHFRIPHTMRKFFPELLRVLRTKEFFPNIIVSKKERLEFLEERSALLVDPKSGDSLPVTDAVIFTGTSHHADRLRLIFDTRTLFIANGAGHNPLIVSTDANIPKAVEATLTLQLYNQGQDCAAPSAILVHKDIYEEFLNSLRTGLAAIKIGPYRDRSCRVGPISNPDDLKRIGAFIVDNREWLDPSTKGVIRASEAIVEPVIICKPLGSGGNYIEAFAPVIFVQKYEQDAELALYFENQHYVRNAMYVSLYGTSQYVQELANKKIEGRVLHSKDTILHNTNLHEPGVERGTQPYGGYGYGASSVSINGKITPGPTCPQRDIFEYLVKPLLEQGKIKRRMALIRRVTKKVKKNISKILGLKPIFSSENAKIDIGQSYLDVLTIKNTGVRYAEFSVKNIFSLLEYPNADMITRLNSEDRAHVVVLRKFLIHHKKIVMSDLATLLYSIPKKQGLSAKENRNRQLKFFRSIYQLLFNRNSGPRLANFLLDADRKKICQLLDVSIL